MPNEPSLDPADQLAKLTRRLERERRSRVEAELIAERGLRDLYSQREYLLVVEKIAVAANQTASVRDALQFAVTTVCEFTGWVLGHSYLCEGLGDGRKLRPTRIWNGDTRAEFAAFRNATECSEFAVGQGLPGRVLQTAQPAWIVDVGRDGNFPRAVFARECGVKTAFAFPVLAGERVAAVMEFFADSEVEPDATLLRLMAQIGTQLGRVAERKQAEDRLIYDASHDALTGLPNRALFLERLERAFALRKRRPEFDFSVLFVDLDRFKVVNDSLGHPAGDSLLVQFAARASETLRDAESVVDVDGHARFADPTLARLGGDEFLILLEEVRDTTDAMMVADRIKSVLEEPFSILDQDVQVSASIGIVSSATDVQSADDVLRNADLALYRAKAAGKARYEVYDKSMHVSALKRLTMEAELRKAVRENAFVLHYQPIVSIADGAIAGFEALVRWQRDPDTLIEPGEFIQLAEDTGLILPLGLWVLREACTTMQRWHLQFPRRTPLSISINLSVRQFSQADLVDRVAEVLRETRIDPDTVRLEITESVAMVDSGRTAQVLNELRALGVRLSIDDFGTGYSSLSYLHRYPLDVLKIDRAFVNAIDKGGDGLQIIRTIINLAHNLRMKVVAEGVETETHLACLQSAGCEFAQGFLFSRPIDGRSATLLLDAQTPGRATRQVQAKSA